LNVIQNLINLCLNLPKNSTYRNVAEGILDNLWLMPKASIYDVVEITNSSRSTVSRMVKLMGYDTFSEFHHQLRDAVTKYNYYNWGLPISNSTKATDLPYMAAGQLRKAADIVEQQFGHDLLQQTAELLHRADKVRLYDLPSTNSYFLVQNLAMAGKQVRQSCLYPDMQEDLPILTDRSVVIFYPLDMPDMMDFEPIYQGVKEKGAAIILGADSSSRFEKYGDIILFSQRNSADYPMASRHAMEMFYLLISEFYRKTYLTQV